MARTATTADVFNAIAEERRREILEALAGGERPVTDLSDALALSQPLVSKHLRVLREVDLVRVRQVGRQRLYSVNGEHLKAVHMWVRQFERFWDHKLARIKARAEASARSREGKAESNGKEQKSC